MKHAPDTTDPIVAQLVAAMPTTELLRVVERPEAERLSGLSWDTIRRRYPELILKLSPRRIGMRMINVLRLAQGP
jgi:hypothetical protein